MIKFLKFSSSKFQVSVPSHRISAIIPKKRYSEVEKLCPMTEKSTDRKRNCENQIQNFFSIRFWRFRLSRKLRPINISYSYVNSYRYNYYQLLYKFEFQQIYCFAIALDCKSKSLVFNSKTMNSVTITKIIGVTIINNLITNPYRLYSIAYTEYGNFSNGSSNRLENEAENTFDTVNRIYECSHDSKINLGLDSFENLPNLEISCSYWISKYDWTLD